MASPSTPAVSYQNGSNGHNSNHPDEFVSGEKDIDILLQQRSSRRLKSMDGDHGNYRNYYDWREFIPSIAKTGIVNFTRWLITGASSFSEKTDEDIQYDYTSLARLLVLLREYEDRFGIPDEGDHNVQEMVLREVTKGLYKGGTPIWALEPVMTKVAEGLTGRQGVNFLMLPRKAFIFTPFSERVTMFHFEQGFCIKMLDDMERIAVRLASFASNSTSVCNIKTRFPSPEELRKAQRSGSTIFGRRQLDKDDLTSAILDLASESFGLFFFLNSQVDTVKSGSIHKKSIHPLDTFWLVSDNSREIFSRLAASEAEKDIQKLHMESKNVLYSDLTIVLFRVGSSAGACAIWFQGGWYDMLVAGLLAVLVAKVAQIPFISRQERLVNETLASFIIGFVSGVLSFTFPYHTCFEAMAIGGVLDILQGFKVVYAVIELMSRHTVTGGADLLEGILFTGLIAFFLSFGQFAATKVMNVSDVEEELGICNQGISEWWYLIFVPVAAFCWSGLFQPRYEDLPLMCYHGTLAFIISYTLGKTEMDENLSNFIAALSVTLSAGFISRFTGKQAVGNTVAGLYVLLPGAYLVKALFSVQPDGFLKEVIVRAVVIGIGAWTGTILCSPTLLGTNKGFINELRNSSSHHRGGISNNRRSTVPNALLYF